MSEEEKKPPQGGSSVEGRINLSNNDPELSPENRPPENVPEEQSNRDERSAALSRSVEKLAALKAQEAAQGTSDQPQEKRYSREMPENWPLEADRLSLSYPLIECLQMMAGRFGRRISTTALMAGLPAPKNGITPSLFIRAAERAHLSARMAERTLDSIVIAPTLPCVLVLEQGQACVLLEVIQPATKKFFSKKSKKPDENEAKFRVLLPETGQEIQELPYSAMQQLYSGHAFFVRPIARVDDRAGPSVIDNSRDWFWTPLWKNKSIYKEVMVAAVVINLFALASPLFIMNVYDRVVPNSAFETLWALAFGVTVVFIFEFILKNLRSHFLDIAGRKTDIEVSSGLFEQLLGMKMAHRPASAGILSSQMKEFEGIRDFFTSATLTAFIDVPFALMFVVLIFVIGGPVGLVPMIMIPIVVAIGLYLQRPLRKIVEQSLAESAMKNALLFETITGLETIKVQAAESYKQRSWEELCDKASATAVKSRRISALAMNIAMFFTQMTSVCMVIVGTYLITEGELSMGALIACVILSGRAMQPLAAVSGLLTRFSQTKQSLDHLNELMKKPVERPPKKNFISKPSVEGAIDFKDVTFHYPEQAVPALKEANFHIKPGEHVGIIGSVGSGKTTIERLLLNLYEPDSGSVQLDGTDVRQVDPGDLRRNIGVVQQSPQLFYGSVRENITMGHETAPERAVVRAAELAGVMDFLKDSQAGLDSQVGERGEALSGGQRQAVAIARSLLYDPPIMILDEPTASMDPASENRLMRRLNDIVDGRTVVLITHKGAMLSLVDKIILLDHGKIIAFGPKDEVIRKLQSRSYAGGTNAPKDNEGGA